MRSRLSQMWRLAIVSVALFCSSGFAAQQSEVVSTRNIYVDLVVPESAPRTLRDRLFQVDAAIRCPPVNTVYGGHSRVACGF